PRVTLVAVVDADTALYVPNFRAAERTFQLITQVAGRCGRSDLGGEVIIQSRHAVHYALAAASRHDYKGFYALELPFRREMNYPPFSHLVNFLIRGANEEKVEAAAKMVAEAVKTAKDAGGLGIDILGPAQAAHYKLHNKFRWQIVIKGTRPDAVHIAREIKKIKMPSGILTSIDIDPMDVI
ncbi:MAG: primosomal protein N', partial [Elusimicrobiota bacterium]